MSTYGITPEQVEAITKLARKHEQFDVYDDTLPAKLMHPDVQIEASEIYDRVWLQARSERDSK